MLVYVYMCRAVFHYQCFWTTLRGFLKALPVPFSSGSWVNTSRMMINDINIHTLTWTRAGHGDGTRGGRGEGIEPPKNSPPPTPGGGGLQAGAGVREPAAEKAQ